MGFLVLIAISALMFAKDGADAAIGENIWCCGGKDGESRDEGSKKPKNCYEIKKSGDEESGVRQIYPFCYCDVPLDVFCDQETDGGGWTVIQRRDNLTVREKFYRTWDEYVLDFGNVSGEYWLGLDAIHALTSIKSHELRIELEDYEGNAKYAKYGFFQVHGKSDLYRLSVLYYSGNAGDALSYHNGANFSTFDKDHDNHAVNCASQFKGAWWYKGCHVSNLNGYQYVGTTTNYASGIVWNAWKGYYYSLRKTVMMVRPAL